MTVALVHESTFVASSFAASQNFSVSATPGAGNTLIYMHKANAFGGGTVAISSITGAGATWSQLILKDASNHTLEVWIGTGCSGSAGANNLTITAVSGTGTFAQVADVAEFSGLSVASFSTAVATGTSSTATAGGITPVVADFVLAVFSAYSEPTFTNTDTPSSFTSLTRVVAGNTQYEVAGAFLTAASTSSTQRSWNLSASANWAAVSVDMVLSGGGSSFTQSADDPAGLTDTTATLLTLGSSATDTAGLVDTTSRVFAYGPSATDTAGLVDTSTRVLAYASSATDTSGLTDTTTRSLSHVASTTDPAGLTDSLSVARSMSTTDAAGLTDSTSRVVTYVRSVTDAVGLVDDFAEAAIHFVTFDDDAGLTDNAAGIIPTIPPGTGGGIIGTGTPPAPVTTGLITTGGKVSGGTVVSPVPGPSLSAVPITTGGTSVGGVTTGGTTVAGAAPTGGQYATRPGYTKLGWYTGYTVGANGTGSLLRAVNSLELLTGQAIEVLSEGLPNDIGDPTNALLRAQGCPQLIVWAAPVVPMGSGSIALGLTGSYDAKIVATGAAFAAKRPKDCLRVGWEALGNYYSWGLGATDPHTGLPNTMADIKKMKRHYVTKLREGGFTGLVDFCDGTDDTRLPYVEEWWPGDDVGDVVGMDVYAGTPSSTYKFNYQYVWDNVRKPALDKIVAFARAHGKYVGFGETGTLSKNTPYVVDDSQHPLFWKLMQQYCLDNCDVILYLCTWNQNQIGGGGVVTEEGQIAYCGNPAGQATNTLHNTAVEGPWYWTPSPNLHQSMLGWRQYMVTGSMQKNGSAVTTVGTPGTVDVTTGGTTTGAVTTGGLTLMPDGSNRKNATVTGGTITGGTVTGGTLAAGVVTGGTSMGGTVAGGTVVGGTVGSGGYVGGTLQADGTLIGGTLTGGTSTGGSVTGGITTEPDGTGVINGVVTGGITVGGTTVGGIYDPRTGILTGGVTTGATTYDGVVTGGILVAPGAGPVNLPTANLPGTTVGAAPVAGLIGWDYTGTGVVAFKVIAFSSGAQPLKISYDVPVSGTGRQHLQTSIGDVSQYSWVIYPVDAAGNIGQGALYTEGWFLDPPTAGYPPLEASPAVPGSVTITSPTGLTTSLSAVELGIGYSNTSNFWYVGAGENVSMYGHTPAMALDDDDNSYWLSIGNDSPTADYAFEWYEVTVPDQEMTSVRFHDVGAGYFIYISVFAAGVWVAHNAADIIPYNARDPLSHNGANIPFAETFNNTGADDGPFEVTLRAPIPKVTKVRITYHRLQDFSSTVPTLPWRAALRKIKVFGLLSSTQTTGGTTTQIPLGPVHDYDSPDVLQSYTTYIPPVETPGAGERPGIYEDYTDIVKLLCAWGGFYWPPNATQIESSGTVVHYDFGGTTFGLANVDPVMGDLAAGRVWGDFANTGVAGIAALPIPQWDKKSLLDGISYVRDIIGFVFYVDETGGVVWRLPNIYSVGNYISALASDPARSTSMVTIDEKVTLIELRAKLSSRNVRERYFVASTDGTHGALAQGYNANPIGLRRAAGWTDQHFGSDTECLIMADQIALRALMTYRVDTIQIPGYPRIQVDDQVQINERVTAESYLHYVRGISSTNDLESGLWTYDLDTNWLGVDPFNNWVFNPASLSAELQAYLAGMHALDVPPSAPPDDGTGGTITKDVNKVAKLVKVTGVAAVYITDGITKRHVADAADLAAMVAEGFVPSATVDTISPALMAAIPNAP